MARETYLRFIRGYPFVVDLKTVNDPSVFFTDDTDNDAIIAYWGKSKRDELADYFIVLRRGRDGIPWMLIVWVNDRGDNIVLDRYRINLMDADILIHRFYSR